MPPPLSRGGLGIPKGFPSSPEAPLLGELSAKQTERLDEGTAYRCVDALSCRACPLRHACGVPPLPEGEALAFRSASSSIGNFSAPPLAAVVAVASGLTDGSRAVSTKKEDPLSELQLREGVFFLVSQMTSSISTFTIYSICHSPQKSSFAQKVYKRPLSHLR